MSVALPLPWRGARRAGWLFYKKKAAFSDSLQIIYKNLNYSFTSFTVLCLPSTSFTFTR